MPYAMAFTFAIVFYPTRAVDLIFHNKHYHLEIYFFYFIAYISINSKLQKPHFFISSVCLIYVCGKIINKLYRIIKIKLYIEYFYMVTIVSGKNTARVEC
jgi:hypothetical protein